MTHSMIASLTLVGTERKGAHWIMDSEVIYLYFWNDVGRMEINSVSLHVVTRDTDNDPLIKEICRIFTSRFLFTHLPILLEMGNTPLLSLRMGKWAIGMATGMATGMAIAIVVVICSAIVLLLYLIIHLCVRICPGSVPSCTY